MTGRYEGLKVTYNLLSFFFTQMCGSRKYCIHTPTTKGHWKFQGGGGVLKAKIFKGK